MLALGIDPDVTDTALAWWDDQGPVNAMVAHVVRRRGQERSLMQTARKLLTAPFVPDVTIAAVEGQQVDGRKVPARSLFTLAQVAGLGIAYVHRHYPSARLLVPTPTEWKGQIPKAVHQARLYDELGWGYSSAASGAYSVPQGVPPGFQHITKGQWKHVGDAILLAKWAYDQATR